MFPLNVNYLGGLHPYLPCPPIPSIPFLLLPLHYHNHQLSFSPLIYACNPSLTYYLVHMYVCVYMYVCVCMYVCMCVCPREDCYRITFVQPCPYVYMGKVNSIQLKNSLPSSYHPIPSPPLPCPPTLLLSSPPLPSPPLPSPPLPSPPPTYLTNISRFVKGLVVQCLATLHNTWQIHHLRGRGGKGEGEGKGRGRGRGERERERGVYTMHVSIPVFLCVVCARVSGR